MRCLAPFFALLAFVAPLAAEPYLPERRLVLSQDVDFYGGDLQPVFEIEREACERLCLADRACEAFTYNTAARACFPKADTGEAVPFEGAISGRVVLSGGNAQRLAATRATDASGLTEADYAAAFDQALRIGSRHIGGAWDVETLLRTARNREEAGQLADARYWTGAAVAQADRADLWADYARLTARLAAAEESRSRQRAWHEQAVLAQINAYLRAPDGPALANSLLDLSGYLEAAGRGRDMIPILRLAQSEMDRPDIVAALDQALARYGFRVQDTAVESDSSSPRICVVMSEALDARVDYTPFLRLDGAEAVTSAQDQQLCVSGLSHGARYDLLLRAGLPAASGETLRTDVRLQLYVRDRAASVRFPGRAYVLPRRADAGLPVTSVNTDQLEITLYRVDDRNVLRSIQEDQFGRPVRSYGTAYLAEQLAEEIWSGNLDVASQLNQDVTTRLPIQLVLADEQPGLFAAVARVPGGEEDGATQWFVLSDLGLGAFQGADGLHVAVNGLTDAVPKEGVTLELYSEANRLLGEGVSDDAGLVTFPPGLLSGKAGAAPALVVAREDTDMAFLSLSDPAFDLSDRGVEGRAVAGPIDVFLAIDRGAYRAGETIHVTALARDATVHALNDIPLTFRLFRPDGVEALRRLSGAPLAGGYVERFALDAGVPRGTWRLAVYADPEAQPLAETRVLVEDFLPERIDVVLTAPEGPLDPSTLPLLPVQVDYLFGAPGADLQIDAELRLSGTRSLEAWPGFVFGEYDAVFDRRIRVLDPKRTDTSGAAQLVLGLPDHDAARMPLQAEIVVSVRQPSGRPVERSVTLPVAPQGPLLGVRPLFEDVAPEDSEVAFQAVSVTPDGTDSDLSWHVNRLTTRYEWFRLGGTWQWEATTTRERVAQGALRAADGTAFDISAPVTWGAYELVLETAPGTPFARTSHRFWAGWYAPAGALETPDTVQVTLDAAQYAPGETAEVLIDARYGGQARIAVLTDKVVSMQSREIAAGETRLRLPVTEAWGQGAYVTVHLLRAEEGGRFDPARAIGVAHAAIAPGARALDVEITLPEVARPNARVMPEVTVDGLAPNQTAHLTLAAVDLGILNLTGFEPPDPQEHYFGQRRLGVEMRDLYGRLIDGDVGQMGRLRQGGDGLVSISQQAPPPDAALMAWFSGPVTTDAQGQATLELDLPEFEGTVRFMAVAWTDTGVGQASADLIVRDPVVISTAAPRFLAPGDRSRLQVSLTHVEGPAGPMTIAVSGPGLLPGPFRQEVSLEAGGTERLDVPLVGGAPGPADLHLTLTRADGTTFTRSKTLSVRANDPAVARTQRVTLAPGETLTLDDNVFAGLRQDSAEVMLSAGPLARFDVPRLLAQLQRYPYGCTEQLTSQALPLLYLSDLGDRLSLVTRDEVGPRIAAAVTQILARQSANGSFGLWRAGAGDLWLDAYVSDFLSRARAAGHPVPDRAFEMALDHLANQVAVAPDFDTGGEGLAYALMVLAREGRAALSDLRYYADVKAEAFGSALASAQLATALARYGETQRSERLFAQASARVLSADPESAVWRADYGSHLRDAAGVLALAQSVETPAVDRLALLRDLTRSMEGHLSTQEQAWMLLAAHEARAALGEIYLDADGTSLSGAEAARFRAGEAPRDLTNRGQNDLPLTLTTLGVPDGPVTAGGTGYRLSRSYYTLAGAPHEGAFELGDRYVTVLEITPIETVGARLMVDDALPAGLEIDSPNLLRSADISAFSWIDPVTTEMTEFRDDRFLAAVDHRGADSFTLAYVVRAVSPGQFHHPAALVEDMYRPNWRGQTASGSIRVIQP